MIFPDAGLPVRVFSPNRFSCGTCDWLSLHGPMAVLDSFAGMILACIVYVSKCVRPSHLLRLSLMPFLPCWMIPLLDDFTPHVYVAFSYSFLSFSHSYTLHGLTFTCLGFMLA